MRMPLGESARPGRSTTTPDFGVGPPKDGKCHRTAFGVGAPDTLRRPQPGQVLTYRTNRCQPDSVPSEHFRTISWFLARRAILFRDVAEQGFLVAGHGGATGFG